MKTAVVGLLMLSLLGGTLASCGPSVKFEDSFETTLNISEPIRLVVVTGSGNIRISRGQDDKVLVSSRFSIWAPSEEAAHKLAEQIKADPPIEQQGNTIKVGDLRKYGLKFGISCNFLGACFGVSVAMSFDIQVPYETAVELDSGSGDQRVSNIRGPVSADIGSGNVEINDIEKEVVADTGSGHIEVTRAAKVDADVGHGDVTLSEISGDVKVDVGLGNISLEEISGNIALKAGSGNIRLESSLGQGVRWRLALGSGDVLLILPADARFHIRAETISGRLRSDFPISGKVHKRELSGVVGESPEAEISIGISSGNIQIKKK